MCFIFRDDTVWPKEVEGEGGGWGDVQLKMIVNAAIHLLTNFHFSLTLNDGVGGGFPYRYIILHFEYISQTNV